jgi:uncharacterized protein
MALGPFQFRGLGFGFTDRSQDLQTPWADIEVASRLDQQHWVGPKTDSGSIKGVLFPEEFGGMDTLKGLKEAAFYGVPLMLVTFAGDVHGLFGIQSITAESTLGKADGSARQVTYTIAIRRLDGAPP